MTLQPNPYALIGLSLILVLVLFARITWQRRSNFYVRLLCGLATISALSLGFYTLQLVSASPAAIRLFDKLGDFGQIYSPSIFFLFALGYAGYERWLTWRVLLVVLGIPTILFVLRLTNDYHHLVWEAIAVVQLDGLLFLTSQYSASPVFWFMVIHMGIVIIGAYVLVLHTGARNSTVYRHQFRMGSLALVGFFLDAIDVTPYRIIDTQIVGQCVAWLPLAWSLLRHQLLSPNPKSYNEALSSDQNAVFIANSAGQLIEANQAGLRFIGQESRQAINQTAQDIFAPFAELSEPLQRRAKSQGMLTVNAGSQQHFYEFTLQDFRDGPNHYSGLLLALQDVTLKRHAEQQALELLVEKERVRLLQEFIQNMTHDLMTPISGMKLSIDLLLRYGDRLRAEMTQLRALGNNGEPSMYQLGLASLANIEQRQHATVSNLQTSTDRLHHLIAGLLDMLKVTYQLDFEFAPREINMLIKSVLNDQIGLATAKNIQLNFEPGAALPQPWLDQTAIEHALANLIGNAIQFTNRGGTVTVQTGSSGRYITIDVADTGIGIAEENIPHIFDSFYRVDKARGTTRGGLGLGLAIAMHVVTVHGGKIDVTSQLGQGSTFRIFLPFMIEKFPENAFRSAEIQASQRVG